MASAIYFKRSLSLLFLMLVTTGCAQISPQFELSVTAGDGKKAQDLFKATFLKHGGGNLASLQDVNVAIDGDWYFLITQIQPDVTDDSFRQQSEERIIVSPGNYNYAAFYRGEAGTKRVFRSENETRIAYNGVTISDAYKESAAALTSDAFYLFALGPLALGHKVARWRRLVDGEFEGKYYYRINGQLSPGIGESNQDFITLWIDKKTELTFRVHITLDGFESTRGAHVDTSFLNYTEMEGFTLPTHFFERVVGPIKIDAHEWWYTGIDINRGLISEDISIEAWSDTAARPAEKFEGPGRDD